MVSLWYAKLCYASQLLYNIGPLYYNHGIAQQNRRSVNYVCFAHMMNNYNAGTKCSHLIVLHYTVTISPAVKGFTSKLLKASNGSKKCENGDGDKMV